MSDVPGGTFASRFSRLSTGIKMLIILGLALFPLGLVAVLASVDAARDGRAERESMARIEAAQTAGSLNTAISRDTLALGITVAQAAVSRSMGQACALLGQAQASRPDLVLGRYALFGADSRQACASRGFVPPPLVPPLAAGETRVWLDAPRGHLNYAVRTPGGHAVGMLDQEALRSIGAATRGGRAVDLRLESGPARLELLDRYTRTAFQQTIVGRARLAHSDVFAVAAVGAIPISAVEIVSIFLPLLMWVAAAFFGWWIVDRLLLRPIVGMQKAVRAYRPEGPPISIPVPRTPATEIRELGEAFVRTTHTIAVHEAELEAGLARQTRLIREVHHRVKNNLQVVASLLNLHARGAKSADAADAYASIQRRVDALSVVHRNHFAELEDDRGVALRSLLSELTGNLRATAPESAAGMAITLDLDQLYVNQDVAVSVAFFVTEIIEHAMLCTPNDRVAVSLARSEVPTVARLTVGSASLKADAPSEGTDVRQFERITTGLSRQLRAVLDRDTVNGAFGIDIGVQPPKSDGAD